MRHRVRGEDNLASSMSFTTEAILIESVAYVRQPTCLYQVRAADDESFNNLWPRWCPASRSHHAGRGQQYQHHFQPDQVGHGGGNITELSERKKAMTNTFSSTCDLQFPAKMTSVSIYAPAAVSTRDISIVAEHTRSTQRRKTIRIVLWTASGLLAGFLASQLITVFILINRYS